MFCGVAEGSIPPASTNNQWVRHDLCLNPRASQYPVVPAKAARGHARKPLSEQLRQPGLLTDRTQPVRRPTLRLPRSKP